MLLVDYRRGSVEFAKLFSSYSIEVSVETLEFGDFAMAGNGPTGDISIGIERKALGDFLTCMNDSRFVGYQKEGMLKEYNFSILIIEGVYRPDKEGYIEVLSPGWDTTNKCPSDEYGRWKKLYLGKKLVTFNQLAGHINTLRFKAGTPNAGFLVAQTSCEMHTTFEVACLYKWFSKPYSSHMSHIGFFDPAGILGLKSSLVRKVAMQLDSIGADRSIFVDRQFNSVFDMVLKSATIAELQAAIRYRTEHPEDPWQQIKWKSDTGRNMGLGEATSKNVHRQLRNGK